MFSKNNFESSDEEVIENKKNKIESDIEEGEVSSDDENFEKYIKNSDDRAKLLNMTEKEREEEIFKRAQEMSDMKSRQKAFKKMNEQEKEQGNRTINKRLLSEIFNSDEESDDSLSSNDSIPTYKKPKMSNSNERLKTLDHQKKSKIDALSQLNKKVKQRKEKMDKISKEEIVKKNSESDISDIDDKKMTNVNQTQNLSSSDSDHFEESEEVQEDKVIESVEDLSKIRLSRHRLEKWVHMPFFQEIVKGCFVRVNIGEGPEVAPIYRIAEIMEAVETVKIYDLGSTRTNAGLRLRIGKSITMFRLLFVSNQNFLTSEFDSWKRRVIADGCNVPKMSFVEQKTKKIHALSNFSVNNEETFKQILQSKQRFQKNPVNYAMKKAELTRYKLAAENEGDDAKANKYQEEIDELNMRMEKLERKRTEGIKNISYINQRNRENTEKDIKKALELERAENLEWEKKGGDPFVREATKPVLNHRKKKKPHDPAQELKDSENEKSKKEEEKRKEKEREILEQKKKAEEAAKLNINNIHDFELNLDIKVDNDSHDHHQHAHRLQQSQPPHRVVDNNFDVTGSIMKAINNSLGGISSLTDNKEPNSTKDTGTNRRALNLSDYKRRKGLI